MSGLELHAFIVLTWEALTMTKNANHSTLSQPSATPATQPSQPKPKQKRCPNQPSVLLAQFNWSRNDSAKTWLLIDLMEKPENFKVLFGTKPGENSSGESKNAVFQRIAR
ncbi:hypothetical protein AAF712_015573, partial [Marasmius tenuissimus]